MLTKHKPYTSVRRRVYELKQQLLPVNACSQHDAMHVLSIVPVPFMVKLSSIIKVLLYTRPSLTI
jgi:hypothetical protein